MPAKQKNTHRNIGCEYHHNSFTMVILSNTLTTTSCMVRIRSSVVTLCRALPYKPVVVTVTG